MRDEVEKSRYVTVVSNLTRSEGRLKSVGGRVKVYEPIRFS